MPGDRILGFTSTMRPVYYGVSDPVSPIALPPSLGYECCALKSADCCVERARG